MQLQKEAYSSFSSSLQSKAINEEELSISFVALSPDNLHKRSFWGNEFYLSVDTQSAKWNAKTFYLDHDVSFDNAIGKIEEVKLENGAFKVKVKFFQDIPSSLEAFIKYKNGLSQSVSVGFGECDLVELEPKDGIPHFQIQNGEIIELSAVWLGADKNAKISKWNKQQKETIMPTQPNQTNQEVLKLSQELEALKLQASQAQEQVKLAQESKNILELGKITGQIDLALNAVMEGKRESEFRSSLLSSPSAPSTLSSQESKNICFSLANYVTSIATGTKTGEIEFSDGKNGLKIPNSFYDRFNSPIKSSDGSVAGIIPQEYRDDRFIEALITSSSLLSKCDHLSNLVGEQKIPRDNSSIEAQWVDEGTLPDAQALSTDSISLRPHCLRAMIVITRTMLSMSPMALEAYIIRKLKEAMRLKLEEALLYGKSPAPITGIFETSGVQQVTEFFTDTNYKKTLDFKAKLGFKNHSLSGVCFAGNIVTQSLLQSTLKDSTGISGYLMNEAGNRLAGIPYELSGLIKDNHILFGNFKNVLVGTWGNELEVQAIKDTAGNITFTAFKDVDIKLKRNDAFVIAKS